MSLTIISLFALLLSINAISARVDAKPLNQNQVKFRRLPPKEFQAAPGSSITIECDALASPPPTIHWLRDGKRILQNDFDENQLEDSSQQNIQVDDINRIALSLTRSRLFIDCANVHDEAVYTCVAENAFSRVSSHTKLNLIKPVALSGAIRGQDQDQDQDSDVSEERRALAAMPRCLRDQSEGSKPVRIHMWSHNMIEILKNNILLYCRSNIKRTGNGQQQVTWTLPDEKLVTLDMKDKYELLETGDLLIKDLRWSDLGSYVCTVSDEQSSDSVSTYVYPASSKATNKRSSVAKLNNTQGNLLFQVPVD